jgi:hypothetical protein
MRTHTTAAILIAAGLLLTSCSNNSDDARNTATTPSPSQPAEPLALGQAWQWADEGGDGYKPAAGSSTVIGYEQHVAKNSIQPEDEFGTESKGYVWAALELKVCTTKGTVTVSSLPWALVYSDGSRIDPSSVTYDDFPRPEYPFDAEVKAGDCVRGNVVYPVPGGKRPERIIYAPEGDSGTAEWAVPKK